MDIFLVVVFLFVNPVTMETSSEKKAFSVPDMQYCEALIHQEDFTSNLIRSYNAVSAFMYCEVENKA